MTNLNNSFFSNKVQEVLTTPEGIITQSSNTIFRFNTGDDLFQIHPFFESLRAVLKNGKEPDLAFPCVQLDILDEEVICDITIRKEIGSLAVLFFDYSTHYEHLHEAAQEKKAAMLNEQAHELNTKHSDEKKAYFEFISERIDGRIIRELEDVVLELKELKKSNITSEQLNRIDKIEKTIGNMHLKAVQIKDGLGLSLD
jgi:hypothetical protein